MRISVAPSFDTIERLKGSPDGDILGFRLVDPGRNRGRGAQSNRSGRFEKRQREEFCDGWAGTDPHPGFETVEHMERASSIITRNSSPDLHFDRSVNPYRGCAHGCSYCYARPTHAYVGHSAGLDFERDIYIKVNAADLLRRELAHRRYRPKMIGIGTNTDPYQPLERKHEIMRRVLEVLHQTDHPVNITTKSALILRDLDLLEAMAKKNLVSVAISLTSMDHKLSRRMEPRASSPANRLKAIRELSKAGIPVHVLAAPMIPAINDMELERIIEGAVAQGASGAQMIMLRLPGEVKDIFREWLLRHYPDKVSHVLNLVRDVRGGRNGRARGRGGKRAAGRLNDSRFGSRMRGQGAYALMLEQRLQRLVEKHCLATRPPVLCTDLFAPPRKENAQLSLF